MIGLAVPLLAMAASLAAADHSERPVEWQSLFEKDGSRWAATRAKRTRYVWTRGHFTRSKAEEACSGTHEGSDGWRLPSPDELGEALSRDQAGDRFWLLAPGTQAYLDQDSTGEGDGWVIRTEAGGPQPPVFDVICVRVEPAATAGKEMEGGE